MNNNQMRNEQLAMSNGKKAQSRLYTLIALEDFKTIFGIDDREDKTARFCLVTATLTIEQYCKRRFLKKMRNEQLAMSNALFLTLREYPVSRIVSIKDDKRAIISSEFYRVISDYGIDFDFPCSFEFSPLIKRTGCKAVKVTYTAGYAPGKVPADLSAACMELAAWNFNRYRGRRIGMTGNVRGTGKDGEHFEMSMPENVRVLIEPYVRRTI